MSVTELKSATRPTRLIFLDCETTQEIHDHVEKVTAHTLRLGVAITMRLKDGVPSGRAVHHFHTREHACGIILSHLRPKQTTWLLAHNAGFDLEVAGLFDLVKTGRLKVSDGIGGQEPPSDSPLWAEPMTRGMIISDPPTIIRLEDESGQKLICLDSMNYVPKALADIGQTIGLPKLTMPEESDPDDDWLVYCQRDVEILEQWFLGLMEFVSDHQLGSIKWTASAQAMTAYRTRFLPRVIESHRIEEVRSLERESYYGGEFRVFRLGQWSQPFYQFDVNSLFPSVMQNATYPYKLQRWNVATRWSRGVPPFDADRSVAEVWIRSDDEDFPRRSNHIPCPTTGSYRTRLCGADLRRATEIGAVAAYRSWAQYECDDLFSEYVDVMYTLRKRYEAEGRSDLASFCKLLLNTLYGKFAQRGSDLAHRPETRPPVDWGMWTMYDMDSQRKREFLCLAGEAYERGERRELPRSVPIVSAFIAAAARQRMREIRAIVDPESLYYQSVDSLIVDARGKSQLEAAGIIDPDKIGYMKLSGHAEHLAIYAHGHYKIGPKHVLPGRKKVVLSESQGGYSQLSFEGIRSTLFREPTATVWSHRKYVRFPDHFRRGIIGDNGRVRPMHIEESMDDYQ